MRKIEMFVCDKCNAFFDTGDACHRHEEVCGMKNLYANYRGKHSTGSDKVFDWDRALEIFKERGLKDASAGLMEDLSFTMGEILRDGKLVTDSYTYLGSTWATPVIVVEKDDDLWDYYECWCYADDEHNPHHYTADSSWEDRHFKEWEKEDLLPATKEVKDAKKRKTSKAGSC